MVSLTDTTLLNSLSYSLPNLQHVVTVHLPESKAVSSRITQKSTHRILEIPLGSRWEPGAHWHEEYVEHIKVLQGSIKVWINGKLHVLSEGQEATFDLLNVHNFCRAEFDSGPDVLLEEWTDHEDGAKIIFFRNAFSLVRDVDQLGGLLWAFLRFFYFCSYRDNYIAFCPSWAPLEMQRAITGIVFVAVRGLGRLFGWKSWYVEYTPIDLRDLAAKEESRKTD